MSTTNLVSITLFEQTSTESFLPTWSFPEFPQQSLSRTFLDRTILAKNSSFINSSQRDNIFVCIASNVFYGYLVNNVDAPFGKKILLLEAKDYHLEKYHELLKLFYQSLESQLEKQVASPLDVLSQFITAFGKNKVKGANGDVWDGAKFSSPHEHKIELLQREFGERKGAALDESRVGVLALADWVNLWNAVVLKKRIVIRVAKNQQQNGAAEQSTTSLSRVANVALALNCLAWNRATNWMQYVNIGSEETLSTHHIFGDLVGGMPYDLLITLQPDDSSTPLQINVNASQAQAFDTTKHHTNVAKVLKENPSLDVQSVSKLNSLTKNMLANLSGIEDLSYEKLLDMLQGDTAQARFLFGLASAENLNQL